MLHALLRGVLLLNLQSLKTFLHELIIEVAYLVTSDLVFDSSCEIVVDCVRDLSSGSLCPKIRLGHHCEPCCFRLVLLQ